MYFINKIFVKLVKYVEDFFIFYFYKNGKWQHPFTEQNKSFDEWATSKSESS